MGFHDFLITVIVVILSAACIFRVHKAVSVDTRCAFETYKQFMQSCNGSDAAVLDSENVHAIFDRLTLWLPEYTSKTPALAVGALVGLIVFYMGYRIAFKEKKDADDAVRARPRSATSDNEALTSEQRALTNLTKDVTELAQRAVDARWVVILAISIALAATVAKIVSDNVYLSFVLLNERNRKHWMLIYFLKHYASALRGRSLL